MTGVLPSPWCSGYPRLFWGATTFGAQGSLLTALSNYWRCWGGPYEIPGVKCRLLCHMQGKHGTVFLAPSRVPLNAPWTCHDVQALHSCPRVPAKSSHVQGDYSAVPTPHLRKPKAKGWKSLSRLSALGASQGPGNLKSVEFCFLCPTVSWGGVGGV